MEVESKKVGLYEGKTMRSTLITQINELNYKLRNRVGKGEKVFKHSKCFFVFLLDFDESK